MTTTSETARAGAAKRRFMGPAAPAASVRGAALANNGVAAGRLCRHAALCCRTCRECVVHVERFGGGCPGLPGGRGDERIGRPPPRHMCYVDLVTGRHAYPPELRRKIVEDATRQRRGEGAGTVRHRDAEAQREAERTD